MIKLIESVIDYDLDELDSLIKEGVDLEEVGLWGMTALMVAASKKCEESLDMLIEAKAKVNAKCERGMTPLMYAVIPYINYEECEYEEYSLTNIETLLSNGADPLEKDNYGANAMMYAWCYRSERELEILEDHIKKETAK